MIAHFKIIQITTMEDRFQFDQISNQNTLNLTNAHLQIANLHQEMEEQFHIQHHHNAARLLLKIALSPNFHLKMVELFGFHNQVHYLVHY